MRDREVIPEHTLPGVPDNPARVLIESGREGPFRGQWPAETHVEVAGSDGAPVLCPPAVPDSDYYYG